MNQNIYTGMNQVLDQIADEILKELENQETEDAGIEDILKPEGIDEVPAYIEFLSECFELKKWTKIVISHFESSEPISGALCKITYIIGEASSKKLELLADYVGVLTNNIDYRKYMKNEIMKIRMQAGENLRKAKIG